MSTELAAQEAGKCTSWFGHKFESRYSSEPSRALAGLSAENVSSEDMVNLLTKKTYERDICVRCGATVEKK
jgi:hypothetical protein